MTPFIKKKEVKKDWYIINAQDAAVGRLAAFISKVLRGKNKPTFNPHIDNGDFVIVTNIDKIRFTGKKFTNKKLIGLYYPLKFLLFFLFLQAILGIFTLISNLNIYLASAHQITSVLLVFSALNLYYFRTK